MESQALKDFNKLLEPFDGPDIKFTDEYEEDGMIYYHANILNLPKYSDWVNNIKSNYNYDDGIDEYYYEDDEATIKIDIRNDFITIEVMTIANDELDESLIPMNEGGIYPVGLTNGANEAFIKIINNILGGNIEEVKDLELIPALGFGGGGRYWYKAKITLDDDIITKFINNKNTPEAKRLLDANKLHINPYSDISIDCSADIKAYIDGVTLDALSDSDANMEILDKESNIIGNQIINILYNAEDKILKVLKDYEDLSEYEDEYEYEDELDESLIPMNESQDPKLGKKIKQLKGWKIYKGTNAYGDETFRCFMPDDDHPMVGYEDWEVDTLDQAISWIENYDLEENLIPIITESINNDENERRVFQHLDNIEELVSNYQDIEINTLKDLLAMLEDEMDGLKDVCMKIQAGIKIYDL